jgi:hypothetical protein
VKGIECEVYFEGMEERLREQEPIFALIRRWCGQEAIDEFNQVLALREEVKRLRELVGTTAGWLRDARHPVKAGPLLKEPTESPDSVSSSAGVPNFDERGNSRRE